MSACPLVLRFRSSIKELPWIVPFFLATLYLTVCFAPVFADDANLDISYLFCSSFAFAHHLRFGVDFLGTYGPWGFVCQNLYCPQTMGWMIIGQCIITAGMFFGLWTVGRNLSLHPLAVGFWIMLFSMWDPSFEDAHILTICLLPMLIRRTNRGGRDSAASYLLAVALALAGLWKFTFLTLSVTTIALLSIEDIFHKCLPKVGLWFMAAVLLLWKIAAQRITDLPAYLRRSWILANGYAESMGAAGSRPFLVAVFACVCFLFSSLIFARFWNENRLGAVIAFLTTSATLFICFKEGCVRYSGHEYVITTALTVVALMFAPLFWIRWTAQISMLALSAVRLFVVISIIGSLWLVQPTYAPFVPPLHVRALLAVDPPTVESRLTTSWRWLHEGNQIFTPTYEAAMAKIRYSYPLPFRSGTTDTFGTNQLSIIAAGMDYYPRPVSPGFQAWSPELIEMNRRFLLGDDAPENIFFQTEAIDDRFPTLEDGALWPILMTRYSPTEITPRGILVLHRDFKPRHFVLTLISTDTYHMDQRIRVPSLSKGILWAQIDLKQTLAGRLGTTLLRSPEVELECTAGNGAVGRYRLIPGMAKAGFVLSPFISSAKDFLSLMTSPARLQQLTDISIHVKPTPLVRDWYDPRIQITFQRLDVPPLPPLATPHS